MGFKFKSFFKNFDANGSDVEDVADTSGNGFTGTEEQVRTLGKDLGYTDETLDELMAARKLVAEVGGKRAGEYDFTNAEVAVIVALGTKSVVQHVKQAFGDDPKVATIAFKAGAELCATTLKLVK